MGARTQPRPPTRPSRRTSPPTTPAPVTPLALPVLLLRSTSSPTLVLTRTWCWRPPRLTSMPPNQQPAERLTRPTWAPSQAVKAPREPLCLPPRRSSPTPTSGPRTAPPARLVPRDSSAPPAAPTTSSPPWKRSSTLESPVSTPCAPPPPRRTSTPRLRTALTRTPSPAPPRPTSPPSTPTLVLVKDVLMLPVSSSETRDRHRSFQAWMFLVCNEKKSLPKSHRYYQ